MWVHYFGKEREGETVMMAWNLIGLGRNFSLSKGKLSEAIGCKNILTK